MPIIKPISDLRNKANEISKIVHSAREPIYITKNGEGDMVIMSIAQYRQLQKETGIIQQTDWGPGIESSRGQRTSSL